MNDYNPSPHDEAEFVSAVMSALRDLEYDVSTRNHYMNTRDAYVYGSGLWTNVEIDEGNNATMYNFLPRVVDVHTAQLMGRGFRVFSTYEKSDVSLFDDISDPDGSRKSAAMLENKKRQSDADARKRAIDSIIRDNGGMDLFKSGARGGSLYGETIFKMWFDKDEQRIKIVNIESPQNYRAGWSNTNFRERDFDAYAYQMSASQANRLYAGKLKDGSEWSFTPEGSPFGNSSEGNTSDPISNNGSNPDLPTQTQRKMVTCIDFTGYLDGWAPDGKTFKKVKYGQEKKISCLIVGGHVVQSISDEKLMPSFYPIQNRFVPRRSWGDSDLPDSALEINADYIERMSDYVTIMNKTVFPMYQMKGFDPASLPRKKPREIVAVSMTQDQSIDIVQTPAGALAQEFGAILNELKEAFVKVTGIGRVLFDDPSAVSDSNQAMLTSMKGVIDIVEDKQSRWEPALDRMFNDALHLAAEHISDLKDVINTEEDWHLRFEWPSALRREDSTYRTMWLNEFNAGTISFDTYLEKIGIEDVSEEIERIRDNYADKTTAAIASNSRKELAMGLISPPQAPQPDVKISLKGTLTPEQEGNLAESQGFNKGPFGASIGPQGSQGEAANENLANQGDLAGNPFSGGLPINHDPSGAVIGGAPAGAPSNTPNPTMTTDNNQGAAPTSQPGSGLPAVSPEGAIAMNNQQTGR